MSPLTIRVLPGLALALAALVAAFPGCKPVPSAADGITRPHDGREGRRRIKLPAPFPTPRDPILAAHVSSLSELLGHLRPFMPQLPADREVAEELLHVLARPDLETAVLAVTDLSRPVNLARINDEFILAIPVTPDAGSTLGPVLGALEAHGKFGARTLPPLGEKAASPPNHAPSLIWHDTEQQTLVFADTPRGLVTGRELEGAYGRGPVFFTVGREVSPIIQRELPFERLTISGRGPRNFEARVSRLDEQAIPELGQISSGALTGLLQAPQVAWGLSTRYAHHKDAVAQITAELTAQVRNQNFLVRGILEDLLRRFNAVVRSWNGRLAFGAGPKNHVLLGVGTDDVARAERAALHLLSGVLDNLKLASTFGLQVPRLHLRKKADGVSQVPIHELTVKDAGRQLDPAVQPLLTGPDLKLALAFPARGGAALVVAGPEAVSVARTWIKSLDRSIAPADALPHLLAAAFAVSPEQLAPILEGRNPLGGIGLSADAPPTYAVLRQEGTDLVLRVAPEMGDPPAPIK